MIIIVSLLLSNYSTSFESLEQIEAILLFFLNGNFSFAAGFGSGQSWKRDFRHLFYSLPKEGGGKEVVVFCTESFEALFAPLLFINKATCCFSIHPVIFSFIIIIYLFSHYNLVFVQGSLFLYLCLHLSTFSVSKLSFFSFRRLSADVVQ